MAKLQVFDFVCTECVRLVTATVEMKLVDCYTMNCSECGAPMEKVAAGTLDETQIKDLSGRSK